MEILYRGKHYPSQAQVALFNADDPETWPPLAQDKQAAIGTKGIVVATIPPDGETEVEICVYRANAAPYDGVPCATGIIEVSASGLLVGTEVEIDVSVIHWPKGVVAVAAYVETAPSPRVTFVLGTTHVPLLLPQKNLPPEVIRAIDDLLQVPHQPHTINILGTVYTTSGLRWELPWTNTTSDSSLDIDQTLNQVRQILGQNRLFAYKKLDMWGGLHSTDSNTIVVFRGKKQYDILRFENGTFIDPLLAEGEWYVETLKKFHRAYGIDIVGVGKRMIEFRLHRTLAGRERTLFLDQLLEFCPDIKGSFFDYTNHSEQDSLSYENLYDHPYFNIEDGRIALWWD